LRGAAGLPGHPGFMMVMDRLYLTLDEKIEIWALEANFTGGKGFFNSLGIRKRFRSGEMTPEIMERITVAYDIARALNFLHERKYVNTNAKREHGCAVMETIPILTDCLPLLLIFLSAVLSFVISNHATLDLMFAVIFACLTLVWPRN